MQEKQAPIMVDPTEGRITIENYQTDQFTINHLSAHSEAITDMASGLAQVEKWIRPPGGRSKSLPDLNRGLKEKIEVESLKMTVPFEAVNKMIPKLVGRQLKDVGVTQISVSKGENDNELAINGRARKLFVEVGFSATGILSVKPNGKPAFSLNQSRVAGFAMPNLLAGLATAVLAGGQMKELGVTQLGSEFALDPNKMLPPNIKSNLTTISIGEEGFVIEGRRGPEKKNGPS